MEIQTLLYIKDGPAQIGDTIKLMAKYKSMKHRLLANIKLDGDCWTWTAKLNEKGYGFIGVWCEIKKHSLNKRAHRVSYEEFKGKIPKGHVIDHKCRNRACINPDHLESVTQKVNIKRRDVRRQMMHDGSELVTYGSANTK